MKLFWCVAWWLTMCWVLLNRGFYLHILFLLCKLMSWSIEECIYLQWLRFRKNRNEPHRQDNIQLIACLNGHFKDQNQLLDTFVKLELIFSCQRDIEDRDKLHIDTKNYICITKLFVFYHLLENDFYAIWKQEY